MFLVVSNGYYILETTEKLLKKLSGLLLGKYMQQKRKNTRAEQLELLQLFLFSTLDAFGWR